MPLAGFASPTDLAHFVTRTAERLRATGTPEAARVLSSLDATAFATGSEWLGELGLLVRQVQREFAIDPDVGADLDRIISAVHAVWPGI